MDWEVVKESLSVFVLSPFQDDLALILWGAYLAFLLGMFYWIFRRQTLGKALTALIENEAFSEESAKTAEEMGKIDPAFFAGKDRLIGKVTVKGESPRFYLPENCRKKADYFLKASGEKWWVFPCCALGAYLVIVIIYHSFPLIRSLLEMM